MRRIILLAMLLAPVPGFGAASAATPCLTPPEFMALTRFALPAAIAGVAQRCAPVLAAQAFLPREGTALAARYAEGAQGSWPAARAALTRVIGESGPAATLATMPDPSLQDMVRATVSGFVAGRLPTDRCQAVDTILQLVAPLPAEDAATLIATAVGLTSSRLRKVGPIAVCPA